MKEHISAIVLCVAIWVGVIVLLALKTRGTDIFPLMGAIGSLLAVVFYVILYNRMMIYVENRAYSPTPDDNEDQKKNN